MLRTFLGRLLQPSAAMLTPGSAAPAFSLPDHLGRTVRLDDFRGRRILLWFYPKADTPG